METHYLRNNSLNTWENSVSGGERAEDNAESNILSFMKIWLASYISEDLHLHFV